MTLYYGLYARHRELDNTLNKAVPKSKHHILQSFIKWRNPSLYLLAAPLFNCPECSREMLLAEVYYDHHRVSLQDLYEQKMAKTKYHSV